ncbi:hypothetical protein NC652_001732 [Populus alba x Populus x berolinensis]|nr:hypothetical protein NC652_001732 [Populus alba x Populus x berolinensis]
MPCFLGPIKSVCYRSFVSGRNQSSRSKQAHDFQSYMALSVCIFQCLLVSCVSPDWWG